MDEMIASGMRTPPPPIPPDRRPGKSGSGWFWAVIVLAFLMFGGLLVAGLMVFLPAMELASFSSGRQQAGGRPLQEIVLEDNGSRNKIAVIELSGIITSQSLDRSGRNMVSLVKEQLQRAADDARVKAAVLKVDSPGGEVLASDDIARLLREFQENSGKPVIVSMGGLAASGGYYVSAPCRWIVANELTITGSIGVIMQSLNYRGLMDKVGLRPHTFKSGKFKDMLSGMKDPSQIDPAETAMVQEMVNETFDRFKQVVRDGREKAGEANRPDGRNLVPDWAEYADGRVLSGRKAHELGFVDELGTFETAVERAKIIASLEDANLIRYRQIFDLGDMLGIFGRGEPRELKVDLGVELPRIEAGRMYFLSPTYLH